MSGEEEYKPKTKRVDINVNVGKSEKEVTTQDCEQLAKELSAMGIPTSAKDMRTVSDYEAHKRILRLELAKSIGREKQQLEREQALQNVDMEGGSEATGQATLTGEQATGSEEGSTFDYSDIPLDMREFPDYKSMIANLKLEASNPESEYRKEAKKLLFKLAKKLHKSKGTTIELENIEDVVKYGKKPVWKEVRENE